jgi:hypothetical protein
MTENTTPKPNREPLKTPLCPHNLPALTRHCFTPPTEACNNCSTFSKRFLMLMNVSRNALLLVLCLLPVAAQAQVKMLRHPTYSKGKVAFSYLGDIFVANENGADIVRLTDNTAREIYPRFSPDGNWIAFSWRQAQTAHLPQRR